MRRPRLAERRCCLEATLRIEQGLYFSVILLTIFSVYLYIGNIQKWFFLPTECVFCVTAVTATDLDSVTNSQLTYSVSDNSFTVQTLNNIGYIKTAK